MSPCLFVHDNQGRWMKGHGGHEWKDDGCSCSRLFEQLVVGKS